MCIQCCAHNVSSLTDILAEVPTYVPTYSTYLLLFHTLANILCKICTYVHILHVYAVATFYIPIRTLCV